MEGHNGFSPASPGKLIVTTARAVAVAGEVLKNSQEAPAHIDEKVMMCWAAAMGTVQSAIGTRGTEVRSVR
jgi:hypothetical protein